MLADRPGFVPWFRRDLRHWRWMAWMALWVLWGTGALIWEWAPPDLGSERLEPEFVGLTP